MKYIREFNEVNFFNNYKTRMINEENPFENEIRWGDSLLGRLINSTIRKIKIGANITRIKLLNERLKMVFDQIITDNNYYHLEQEDQKKVNNMKLFDYLTQIDEDINLLKDKKDDQIQPLISEMKNLTILSLQELDKNDVVVDDKDKLKKDLKSFKELLDKYKKDNDNTEKTSTETGIQLANINSLEKANDAYSSAYKIIQSNQNADVNTKLIEYTSVILYGLNYMEFMVNSTNFDKTTGSMKNDKVENKKIEAPKIDDKQLVASNQTNNEKINYFTSYKKIYEDANMLPVNSGTTSVVNTNNNTNNDDVENVDFSELSLEKAINKLINIFNKNGWNNESVKLSNGLSIKANINTIISYKNNTNMNIVMNNVTTKYTYNTALLTICKQIALNKAVYGVDDKVYEAKDTILATFTNDLPKVVSLVLKEVMGMANTMNMMVDNSPLKILVKNIAECYKFILDNYKKINNNQDNNQNQPTSNKEVKQIEQPKISENLNFIKSFESFMSVINEDNEEDGDSNNDNSNNDNSNNTNVASETDTAVNSILDDIIVFWTDNFDPSKYKINKKDFNNLNAKLEDIQNEDYPITLFRDNIIEIVKIFNRAYKLHTVPVIPTDRTNGRVSNKTFREYTSFGGGVPQTAGASGGPYRNNAIFNAFEDCVLDIQKNAKYKKIFSGTTTFENIDENGDIKDINVKKMEGAGKKLERFMIDMLDGDQLYKNRDDRNPGTQALFLKKYFNIDVKNEDLGFSRNEYNDNAVMANNIKEASFQSINNQTVKKLLTNTKLEDLEGTFLYLNCVDKDNKNIPICMNIQYVDDTNVYLSYCKSVFYYKKMIDYVEKKNKSNLYFNTGHIIGNRTYKKDDKKQMEYAIKYTTIPIEDFYRGNEIHLKGEYKISYVELYNNDSNDYGIQPTYVDGDNSDILTINNVDILCKDDNVIYVLKNTKELKNNTYKYVSAFNINNIKKSKMTKM